MCFRFGLSGLILCAEIRPMASRFGLVRAVGRDELWQNVHFVQLWGAATISTFGSLVSGVALPFVAILALHASPASLSALRIAQLLPGFLIGLIAGAWVDRLPRRPIMIATDLARAGLMAAIPLAAIGGWLGFELLYAVAALTSALGVFFDVAFQSYLPSLVRRHELIAANSRISAAGSVAEAAAFSSAGWLVQLLTAPMAMLVDAATFIVSAVLVTSIRAPEPQPEERTLDELPASVAGEIADGLRAVWHEPLLRGLVAAGIFLQLAFGMIGTVFVLYTNQEVGFAPSALGMIFAVGGVSSFLGAAVAGRLSRFGIGTVMVAALLLAALGTAFVPLATAANLVGVVLLVGQQLVSDAALTIYEINQVSVRQAITAPRILGRVNASVRVAEMGAVLLGTVAAGYLGETIGLRSTLWLGVAATVLAAIVLALSPVRGVDRIPEMPLETMA
jgi:MFS family permease